ncbi:MAG: ThuA domain-containing protein [Promethearchaeota archaeon]
MASLEKSNEKIRVTVWNEYVHEKKNKTVAKLYPNGIHNHIGDYLKKQGFEVKTATLDDKEHGLTEDVLENTDVLIWWGHAAHHKVKDKIVDRVQKYVLVKGMGLIVLHSAHYSKIFKRLMGTSCGLTWREDAEREYLWCTAPYHPIAQGIEDGFIENEYSEMYGEFFDVPKPDDVIFISNFEGGEVFRSVMTWTRGRGRIVYIRPGHETYPVYHNPQILKLIENSCRWAKFRGTTEGQVTIGGASHTPWTIRPVEDRGYKMDAIDHEAIKRANEDS